MSTDKTNKQALHQLQEKYKDEILEYEYKHWKESYLAPPPPRSYAQSMLRYRMCCKIVYIKLKDGRKIKVGGLLHGVEDVGSFQNDKMGCFVIFGIIGLLLFIWIIV